MSNVTNELKSKWGYHPCSYQLFLKLKSLHRWYWQTVYDIHRWHRWWRKEPQNRIGAEPPHCPEFVQNRTLLKSVATHGEHGFWIYLSNLWDHDVRSLYQCARLPQPESVDPFDTATIERIESLYSRVADYFQE